MIIATAGHIDHGKTALVHALTGQDTDRLPEEKARGISIDTGFAHLDFGEGQQIGFVDVPGHERFVRNMLSGVYAVSRFLLVVAADDGIMAQTREHLQIVKLLGVTPAAAVITKTDRVDPPRVEVVSREVSALLDAAGYPETPVLAVSARTLDGIDGLRLLLETLATDLSVSGSASAGLTRYVIDRVFTSHGVGTIVRGTVLSGCLRVGESLKISPGGQEVRIRRLERFGREADHAVAGQRCAANLAGEGSGAAMRGCWIVDPRTARETDRIMAHIDVLGSEKAALKHWTPVHVHIGSADVTGRIAIRRGAAIAPAASGRAELRLQLPVNAVHGDMFILRDQSATRTIGGGRVIDPFPSDRRFARDVAACALDGMAPVAGVDRMLVSNASGVDLAWLANVYGCTGAEIRDALPADSVLLETEPPVAFGLDNAIATGERVRRALSEFHAKNIGLDGMEASELRRVAAPEIAKPVFDALLTKLAASWQIESIGTRLRILGHDSTDNPLDRKYWTLVADCMAETGFDLPSLRELSEMTQVPLVHLRDLMYRKAQRKEAVRLTPDRFVLPETLEQLSDRAVIAAERAEDGAFTAAQYRDVIGTGRKVAIQVLECLDRKGLTIRTGNIRRLSAGAGGDSTRAQIPQTQLQDRTVS